MAKKKVTHPAVVKMREIKDAYRKDVQKEHESHMAKKKIEREILLEEQKEETALVSTEREVLPNGQLKRVRKGYSRDFLPVGWVPVYKSCPKFAPNDMIYEVLIRDINRRRLSGEKDDSIMKNLNISKEAWISWIPPRELYLKKSNLVFTDEEREKALSLASIGINYDQIAEFLGITVLSLEKHFGKELKTAALLKHEQVANALITNAVEHNNVNAQIFYLKAKAGWYDKPATQINTTVETTVKLTLGNRQIIDGQLVDTDYKMKMIIEEPDDDDDVYEE